jgi:hypothetical protein
MILSILTPAVPSRMRQLDWLCEKISRQIDECAVEHLVLLDNKRRTVGEKRDALLRIARGKYVAFVDDDDMIRDSYVASILVEAQFDPDVITFRQQAWINNEPAEIEFKLGNPNEPFRIGELVKRNAWHVCAWRRTLAIYSKFPASNYGEDWAYAAPLCRMAVSERHIPRILHEYHHDSAKTEAPPAGVSIVNDAFHAATGR